LLLHGLLHRLLHGSWASHDKHFSLTTVTKSSNLLLESSTSHLHHHFSVSSLLLGSDEQVFVNMLENSGTTLVEPELVVSGVSKHTAVVLDPGFTVESAHHTHLELFLVSVKVGKLE